MSDHVLSDEQRRENCPCCDDEGRTFDYHFGDEPKRCTHGHALAIERAVVAALAQRSGVDVETLAQRCLDNMYPSGKAGDITIHPIAHVIRLALAQQEVRHAEREREVERLRSAVNKNP